MLQHVSIEVPSQEAERMIEFWRLVGFEEIAAPEALGDQIRWVEREGTQIHLIVTEGHTAPALGHAAVVVPDHAEAKQRLRDAGFEVHDARQLWGADRAFALAPGGHRIELMAAPPPRSR
ncbi:MAG: VOC family protein [Solirubrobacterales bacterium]